MAGWRWLFALRAGKPGFFFSCRSGIFGFGISGPSGTSRKKGRAARSPIAVG